MEMTEIPPFVPESLNSHLQLTEGLSPIVYEQGIRSPLERRFSEQSIETANHELNHALVALDYGILPVSISIEPDSTSRGRTTFAGEIPNDVFTIIAAGGAVETVFGNAKGYGNQYIHGSDFGYISQIKKGATNLDEIYMNAVSHARASISRLIPNKEVLRRASAIIADMKHVPGHMIGKIIEIAEQEVNFGVETNGVTISEKIEGLSTSNINYRIQTIIDTDAQGEVTKRVIILDETQDNKTKCTHCGEFGGHEVSCSMRKAEKVTTKLSHSETIFVA